MGNGGEAKTGKCGAGKIRRNCIFREKLNFFSFSDALSCDQLRTKLEKCLWEPDGWIDQSLADFTSALKIENTGSAVHSFHLLVVTHLTSDKNFRSR